jgi:hypothetical protein
VKGKINAESMGILSFEACLQEAAWHAGFIKRFNLNWQTELLKVL